MINIRPILHSYLEKITLLFNTTKFKKFYDKIIYIYYTMHCVTHYCGTGRDKFIFPAVVLNSVPPCATLTYPYAVAGSVSYTLMGGQVHTRLRSPYTLSMRPTVGQNLRPTYIHTIHTLWIVYKIYHYITSTYIHVHTIHTWWIVYKIYHYITSTYIHEVHTYMVDCIYSSLLYHYYIHMIW